MKRYVLSIIALMMTGFMHYSAPVAAADIPLPPANWYAVAWVQETDMLHWITSQGQQASSPRPKMMNEAAGNSQTSLHISPNGRYLVSIAPLNTGNWGIGFYDFSTGQFIQTHEAQPNEAPPLTPSNVFTPTSAAFATVLRNTATGDWRILVFDTATGNATAQLTRTSPELPDTFTTDPTWHPYLARFGIDEGLGTTVIQMQLVTDPLAPVNSFPSFKWYPAPPPILAANPIVPDSLPFSPQSGFDIFATSGQVVLSLWDEQLGMQQSPSQANTIQIQPSSDQLPATLIASGGSILNSPQWLHNGEWVGYRVQGGAIQPHYEIATIINPNPLPLGPNIGAIHDTPDGFVAVNTMDWQLYHATSLDFEGFAANFGSIVFQDFAHPFSIIYTTPEGASFTLQAIAESPLVGDLDIQAPIASCGPAPAPRLAAGMTARAAYTDGTLLRVRSAPFGDIIQQIAEGTIFTVLDGPQCAQDYLWWNIQLNDSTVGWVAEGDSNGYFIEPYNGGIVPPTFQPTPLVLQAVTLQAPAATATPLGFAQPLAPTSTQSFNIQANCAGSPPSQLAVGDFARTPADATGQPAVYPTIDAEFPIANIPANTGMRITDGPACRPNGQRAWLVNVTLNGQSVSGWVAEGSGDRYFIVPGLPRAGS